MNTYEIVYSAVLAYSSKIAMEMSEDDVDALAELVTLKVEGGWELDTLLLDECMYTLELVGGGGGSK